DVRIKVADQIVGLFQNRIQLVSESEIDCEPRTESPVVLQEQSISLVLEMTLEVARSDQGPVHIAAEETLKVGEAHRTFCIGRHIVRALVDEKLAAQFEGMLAAQQGHAIGELKHTVRPYGFWPT